MRTDIISDVPTIRSVGSDWRIKERFARTMDEIRNKRNSTIELVRIICMLLIVSRHYYTMAEWGDMISISNWSWRTVFVQLAAFGGGAVAINTYLLISGYYMVDRKLNWKRIVALIGEVFIYSWLILAINCGFGIIPISTKGIIKSILPIWFGYNWYVVCYIIMCCFLPFINKVFMSASQEGYRKFLLISFILVCVAKTFRAVNYIGPIESLDHFIFAYSLGGYIKRFGLTLKKGTWKKMFFATVGLLVASIIIMNLTGYILKIQVLLEHATYFTNGSSFLALAVSVCLFLWAITSKPFYNKGINRIAKSMIGVFIIHQNPISAEIIWNRISPNINQLTAPRGGFILLHFLLKITIVFFACVIIDQVRLETIDKLFTRYVDKKWAKAKDAMKIVSDKAKKIIPFE